MKYMRKKDEDTLVPYDEFIYDASVYDVVDGAADKPTKAKKAPVAKPDAALRLDEPDDDFDFG